MIHYEQKGKNTIKGVIPSHDARTNCWTYFLAMNNYSPGQNM